MSEILCFSEDFLSTKVHFQIFFWERCAWIWIGSSVPKFETLSIGIATRFEKEPLTKVILGVNSLEEPDKISKAVVGRFPDEFKACFSSYDVDDGNDCDELRFWCRRTLLKRLDVHLRSGKGKLNEEEVEGEDS